MLSLLPATVTLLATLVSRRLAIALVLGASMIHPQAPVGAWAAQPRAGIAVVAVLCLPASFSALRTERNARIIISLVTALILWTALRSVLAGQAEAAPFVRIWCAALLGLAVARDVPRFTPYLYWLGVTYIAATWLWGVETAGSGRFSGLAGNPNRLVTFLCVLVPWLLLRPPRWRAMSWTGLTMVAAAAGGIARTGSAEALVVIGATLLVGVHWLRTAPQSVVSSGSRRRRFRRTRTVAIFAIAIIGVTAITASVGTKLVAESSDLSSRRPIFETAIDAFSNSPVTGTGTVGVFVADEGRVRATHNTVLGLVANGGVLSLLILLVVGPLVLRSARSLVRAHSPLGWSVLALLFLSLSQNVESYEVTWFLIAAACASANSVSHRAPTIAPKPPQKASQP